MHYMTDIHTYIALHYIARTYMTLHYVHVYVHTLHDIALHTLHSMTWTMMITLHPHKQGSKIFNPEDYHRKSSKKLLGILLDITLCLKDFENPSEFNDSR